jgi:predicted permease
MGIWTAITQGLRALLRRGDADRDLDDEVRHFMQAAEDDLVAGGVPRREARRKVRLEYGDPLAAREDVRSWGWEAWVDTLVADFRLGTRSLFRTPGFTAVAVLTLGLGVGAATAIFSVVRPVLFEPLGYPDPHRLVSIEGRAEDGSSVQSAFGTYRELAARSRSLSGLAVVKPWLPTLTGGEEPVRLEGQSVSASYFPVLGVAPALGPGFDAVADQPGGDLQVILSDGLWRTRFGADPSVVGRTVELDGRSHAVVGVMPRDFENVTAPGARAWTLLQYDPTAASFDTREWGHHLDLLGRLRAGSSLDDARRGMDRIAASPGPAFPRPEWAALGHGVPVRLLRDAATATARPTVWIFTGAVALLLLVTCANLTLLLLARGARRRGEFAMRGALGAGRLRLARYLVTESLILTTAGGVVGFAVAELGVSALVALGPASLPRLQDVGLDGAALLFTLTLTTVVGVAFGLAPGLHRSAAHPQALREAGRGAARRGRTTRQALVVAQVAMATVLLVGSGLILRSTQRIFSQPIGFEADGLVVVQVYGTGLASGDAVVHGFFDRALDAVRAVPGVASAAETSQFPLSGDADVYGVTAADGIRTEGSGGSAFRYAVTPGYLETMGMGIQRGRALDRDDGAGAPGAVVVSRRLALRLFGGEDPIGRTIQAGAPRPDPYTIVGVVDDVPQSALGAQDTDAFYVSAHQWHWADRVRWMVVRAEGDPLTLVPAIRQAVWSVDGNQPVVRAQTARTLVADSETRRRFVLLVLSAFAAAATALAVLGLYGVVSGMVVERMPEMGVRAALGAPRERIVGMIVRQGLALAGAGVVVGVLGAMATGGTLDSLLFQVSPADPLTYAAVAALLLLAAGVACVVPATRAARADPVRALKTE